MSTFTFEAVVTASKQHGISAHGEEVRLVGCLPERAKMIPADMFEGLQNAFDGDLEILWQRGRIFVEQTVMACSTQGVRTARRRLVDHLDRHLNILATVQ